jgi:hypothetical protein
MAKNSAPDFDLRGTINATSFSMNTMLQSTIQSNGTSNNARQNQNSRPLVTDRDSLSQILQQALDIYADLSDVFNDSRDDATYEDHLKVNPRKQ